MRGGPLHEGIGDSSTTPHISQQSYKDIGAFLASLPEWSNKDRLSFLFAEFPPERNADNSTSYDSLLTFWTGLIKETATMGFLSTNDFNSSNDALANVGCSWLGPSTGSVLTLQSMHLHRRFLHLSTAPLGIDTVLNAMVSDGACIVLEDFMPRMPLASSYTTSYSISALAGMSWLMNSVLLTPLKWSLEKVTGTAHKPWTQLRRTLVVLPLIQAAANKIRAYLERHTNYSIDLIMDLQSFQDLCSASQATPLPPSAFDVQIILEYLRKTQMVVWESVSNTSVGSQYMAIKLRATTQNVNDQLRISDIDKGVVTIKATIRKLSQQVDQLDAKIQMLAEQTQLAVLNKPRGSSIALIRQRRSIEAIRTQRYSSLETIRGILSKIQDSESEYDVLDAYASGTCALKGILKTKNLTVERTENIMDDLQETLASFDDVQQALSYGNMAISDQNDSSMDMTDLDRELDALILAENTDTVESKLDQPTISPPSPLENLSSPIGCTSLDSSLTLQDIKTAKLQQHDVPELSQAITSTDSEYAEKPPTTKKKLQALPA
ncbi:hypothetical protein BASA50_003678 [Batrachochytrium salamandrivorans]|uniref:Charged multivesicular body protein 7 n=1 Tax=Batrachochytrium salamandrivorans TaxID=1357716 RepID=A0ABQ8FI46_9FUNG|nr:hypothetical protein BASA50_003678 [Batrachochytrium salamandrivorans]